MQKWPPNTEGAERSKNEADKSSLYVNEFNRELTYRNAVLGDHRTKGIPIPSIYRQCASIA